LPKKDNAANLTEFYLQCLGKLDNRFAFDQNPKTLCKPKHLLKKDTAANMTNFYTQFWF
jgi:hypothetical protein